ncbi:MBL fold metallo-hydrolase [Amycolatopsis sp. PS_44_ISF1]|uniref:MBL fold metallo-hydrolase n=1 Tax=Amycolatopsis sp. PS_44_ISF1 TaxID=2974917 RepID=UPI0028DFD9B4|nr:MBL fold metallo-hydrolase [Amycolatopsis sp. PS_44_ISF1]MDT8911300.1 MBL fold metallo-hydrolase [Amycolatopsis sp. PS_44_ISF1]
MRSIELGNIEIHALADGLLRLPTSFFPGLDAERHSDAIAPDGKVHVPTGAYLVRGGGRTILVDAGFGPREIGFAEGGQSDGVTGSGGGLPVALAEAGVRPADIDTLVLTHLHADHVGWVAPHGVPYFPNAEVVYGEADWAELVETSGRHDWTRISLEAVRATGQLRPLHGDVELAPGITARAAPGHTPGHYVLDLVSEGRRAVLLGDVLHTPAQLADPGIRSASDTDPSLTHRTRQRWLQEVEGTDTVVAPAHFPGLQFFRITADRVAEPVSAVPAG